MLGHDGSFLTLDQALVEIMIRQNKANGGKPGLPVWTKTAQERRCHLCFVMGMLVSQNESFTKLRTADGGNLSVELVRWLFRSDDATVDRMWADILKGKRS